MAYKVDKVEVWMGLANDTPGALGRVLDPLSQAGAKLEFLFARPGERGKAIFFLAPLKGAAQTKAARSANLVKCSRILSLRIKGPDRRGLGARVAKALGGEGVNIRGFSAMGIEGRALLYLALEKKDVNRALKILRRALSAPR